jgi:hypothetical protein
MATEVLSSGVCFQVGGTDPRWKAKATCYKTGLTCLEERRWKTLSKAENRKEDVGVRESWERNREQQYLGGRSKGPPGNSGKSHVEGSLVTQPTTTPRPARRHYYAHLPNCFPFHCIPYPNLRTYSVPC